MAKTVDLTGKTYGRLTVISKADFKDARGSTMWNCQCCCGNIVAVRHSSLTSGNTKSCGCYQRQRTSQSHIIHGYFGERLYFVWNTMKQRCNNPNNTKYKDYGGRGITVCKEWKNNYLAFRSWAYENGYDENSTHMQCTIDRIDVDGNYEPSNCRWVDNATQAKNKRPRKTTHC